MIDNGHIHTGMFTFKTADITRLAVFKCFYLSRMANVKREMNFVLACLN